MQIRFTSAPAAIKRRAISMLLLSHARYRGVWCNVCKHHIWNHNTSNKLWVMFNRYIMFVVISFNSTIPYLIALDISACCDQETSYFRVVFSDVLLAYDTERNSSVLWCSTTSKYHHTYNKHQIIISWRSTIHSIFSNIDVTVHFTLNHYNRQERPSFDSHRF